MDSAELVFTKLVPAILFILMFGMGLSLTPTDFMRVIAYPKAAVIGLVGQMVLLPTLAFFLAIILDAPPAIAIGGMLLAACPGGVTSNGYVFVSRGDLGLSVTLTAITSILTIFTIPMIAWFALHFFLESGQAPHLPAGRVVYRLALLTALPVGIGMLVRHVRASWAAASIELLRRISLALLLVIIIGATIGTFDTIAKHLLSAGVLAVCLNLSSMALGYFLGRSAGLPKTQVRTITFEIGVQNLSLAVLVAVTILDRPEFAVLAVVYAFVMKITVLTLIAYWRRTPVFD